MNELPQQLVNGLLLGSMYGLVAIGYTMVYGIVQLINFAHGEIFMTGAFGALTVYLVRPARRHSMWIALPLMLVGAVIVSVTVAVGAERFAYRPLRGAPRLAPLITAIGLSLALQQAVWAWYPDAKSARTFPQIDGGPFDIGSVTIQTGDIFLLVAAPISMAILAYFVMQTRTGRGMQATAQDPDTAKLMGINTDRIIVIAFALGAAFAAVGGRRLRPQVRPDRLPHGLHPRPQGLHRRRPRRHRQHLRRHDRRPRPRRRRSPGHRLHRRRPRHGTARRPVLGRRLGLRTPHPRAPASGHRACSASASRTGRDTDDHTDHRTRPPAAPTAPPRPSAARRSGRALATGGGILTVVSTFLAWTWTAAFPGDLTVYGYPGGLQVLVLIGGALTTLFGLSSYGIKGLRWLTPGGADSALKLAALGTFATTWYTVIAISAKLGGLVNLEPGGCVAALGHPRRPGRRPRPALQRPEPDPSTPTTPPGTVQAHSTGTSTASEAAFTADPAPAHSPPGPRSSSSPPSSALGLHRLHLRHRHRVRRTLHRLPHHRRLRLRRPHQGRTRRPRLRAHRQAPQRHPDRRLRRRRRLPLHPVRRPVRDHRRLHPHLRHRRPRPEHRRRPRRPPRPRLRRLPRRRRLRRRPGLRLPLLPLRRPLPLLGRRPPRRRRLHGLRRPHRRPDPATARRLPRHRHPRLRRDLPHHRPQPRRHQRTRPHQRLQRHLLASPTSTSSASTSAPDTTIGGFTIGRFANYFLLMLLITAVVVLVFRRSGDSRIGRAWVAIREDETAALAMGINGFRRQAHRLRPRRHPRRTRRHRPGPRHLHRDPRAVPVRRRRPAQLRLPARRRRPRRHGHHQRPPRRRLAALPDPGQAPVPAATTSSSPSASRSSS